MQSDIHSAFSPMLQSLEEISQAVEHRRNFAIISHPDAGKTTLTEKLLLYGGAIQRKLPPNQLTEALARATFSYFCSRLTGYNLSLCLTGACFEVIAPIF
jgi:hypothetical protein